MQVFESSGYIDYGVRGELYSNSSTRHIIWKLLDTQGSTDTPASNVSESYPDAQDFPFFFEAKYFLRDCNYKNCGQSFETGTERINHEVEAHNRCITCEMYFKARSALELSDLCVHNYHNVDVALLETPVQIQSLRYRRWGL